VLCAVSGDREAAGEAVAEAFARALARWPRVSRMERPDGWVYKVALNLWKKECRRRGREANFVVPAGTNGLDTDYEIWAVVGKLPPRQREVLALRHIGQLSVAEMADVLGISVSTVTSTLTDARHNLTEALDPNVG
jgi:DNA-directed RNA polymerase specialized sigma24 family protein